MERRVTGARDRESVSFRRGGARGEEGGGRVVSNRSEKWTLQKWCSDGGADRSACKRFPAPVRGVRGARTYRCRDRGALRGAIPFSCHVQPMMRLLHSYLAPRYRRLPSHGLEEPLLSLSLPLRSLGARARPYVFFSLLPLRSPFPSFPSSVATTTKEQGEIQGWIKMFSFFFFFFSSLLEFRIWRRSCLASCLICPIVFLRNAWMERTRRMYSRVRIW